MKRTLGFDISKLQKRQTAPVGTALSVAPNSAVLGMMQSSDSDAAAVSGMEQLPSTKCAPVNSFPIK